MDDSGGAFASKLAFLSEKMDVIINEMSKVIIGQKDVVRLTLAAFLCRGHALLVGVPGLAKTMIVRAIGDTTALSFKRVQFTPDLMPSDIIGTNVIDEVNGRREFRFMRGPIFANIVLADEINRTPPKTQAALLEAMQERQVSVGNESYPLPHPFFVVATQNPIDQEGTYPLPEAELDRFMFNIFVDYPIRDHEKEIYRFTTSGAPRTPNAVIDGTHIEQMQAVVDQIVVSDHVLEYVTQIVRATRPGDETAPAFVREMVEWGAGPRAGQYLIRGAKALAAMAGRMHVSDKDIRAVALPVLRHRIGMNFQAEAKGVDSVQFVELLLNAVRVPR